MKLCAIFVAAFLCAQPPAAGEPVRWPPPYGSLRAGLRTTAVPVLLPVPIPAAMGAVRSVAVISAGREGYYIGFSSLENCAGALSCAFFHVAGRRASARPGESAPDRDRSVRLFDGTRAAFRPTDCSGASCTEAVLSFRRGEVRYELDAKVGGNSLGALLSMYRNLRSMRPSPGYGRCCKRKLSHEASAVQPPSTTMVCPLMKPLVAALLKNRIACAMSSGDAKRPIGTRFTMSASR